MRELPHIYSVIRQEHFLPPEVYLYRYEEDARADFFERANIGDFPSVKLIDLCYHGDTKAAIDDFWISFKKDPMFIDQDGVYWRFEEQEIWEG